MLLNRIFENWKKLTHLNRRPAPRRNGRRGWVPTEALEQRVVLSAIGGPIDARPSGIVTISGDPRIAQTIVITDGIAVGSSIHVSFRGSDGRSFETDYSNVDKVVIHGSDQGDHIENETRFLTNVFGNGGDDTLIGGSHIDELHGGDGDDELVGHMGQDLLYGDAGDDDLDGGGLNDELRGGDGDDSLFGETGSDRLFGENGNDVLYGDADESYGGSGKDVLHGGRGDDVLHGGAANDQLRGGDGNDALFGGTGDDHLAGENGNDTLRGDQGRDTLNGGTGANLLIEDASGLVSVGDVTRLEGNSRTTEFRFKVTLTAGDLDSLPVRVKYSTANGSAVAGSDYKVVSGSRLLKPGDNFISVLVTSDTRDESNETFVLNITSATNATVVDGQGRGTIQDDDGPLEPLIPIPDEEWL